LAFVEDIEIDWVQDRDVDEITALFSLVFERPMSPEYYRWQFHHDRFGGFKSARLRVGGRIVSHAGFSPRDWKVNGLKGLVMAKHTSMTHPDCRGFGLYGKLLDWAHPGLAKTGADMILSWPNRHSHPMQRNRTSYEDICQIPVMKWTPKGGSSSTGSAIHECPHPNPLPKGDGASGLGSFRRVGPITSRRARISVPLTKTQSFNFHEWEEVAETTIGNCLFSNIRTLEYLTWRYKQRPDTVYYAIENRTGGKVRSAVVFKLYPADTPCVMNVLEWLSMPESSEADHALDRLEDLAASLGLPVTIWHNVHDYPRHHMLERRGYIPSDPIFYFGVIPLGSSERLGPYRDWRNWYMTMGDVDVF
jgi:hypothetical protein